jgi:putative acetyltransferase
MSSWHSRRRAGPSDFASLDCNTAEVASVYVDPAHMRRGAGRRLIAAVEDAARDAEILRLQVTASLSAMLFYRAVGFALIEHATSCTRGRVEMPCARMSKDLPR